jgi:hypothetical protein
LSPLTPSLTLALSRTPTLTPTPTLTLKLKLKSAYGGARRSAMRGFGGV